MQVEHVNAECDKMHVMAQLLAITYVPAFRGQFCVRTAVHVASTIEKCARGDGGTAKLPAQFRLRTATMFELYSFIFCSHGNVEPLLRFLLFKCSSQLPKAATGQRTQTTSIREKYAPKLIH